MVENGLVNKTFLDEVLQRAVDTVGLNPASTNINQLILLMERLDLCCKTDHGEKYLIPALLPDKDGKLEKGKCKRKWEFKASNHYFTHYFVTRRLQCSDPFRTFFTPSFFP